MPSKKRLQVFVSSTYLDLREERQAAVEAILKAGHIPAGMELFTAGSDSQLDTIQRWIDESDVYMLILGGRYGSIDSKTALSYTELEYDYAVSKEIPVFAVVIADSAIDENVKNLGRSAIEPDRPGELKLFRDKVLARISSFFKDTKDIKLAVHETLSDFLSRYEFQGWVSGSEVAENSTLIEEISRLLKRNQSLEDELASLNSKLAITSKTKPDSKQQGFDEIISILREIKITTNVFSEDGVEKEYPLLNIFDGLRDTLITGISNKAGMEDDDKILFFNVLPKLQVHGLAALEKVAGVQWQRYRLTQKGLDVLAVIDKRNVESKAKKAAADKSKTI